MMDYILGDLVASMYPLIGVGMGIRGFYRHLQEEYDWCPFNDGRDVPTFAFVAMIATLVTGIITGMIFGLDIHMGIMQLFIPEVTSIIREGLLLSYIVRVSVAYILEKFIAVLTWHYCQRMLIENVI